MEYVIVSYRSRAHTVRFSEILRKSGVYCQIISTPKEAGVGCGLSVRLSVSDLNTARRMVRLTALSSFAGIFAVKTVRDRRVIKSI